VRGKACPIPVARTAQAIVGLAPGDLLEVLATDPDIDLDARAWAQRTGHELVSVERREEVFAVRVRKR
jgi:tRNA 2-thiouridine synthesizing protein A